MSYPGDPLMGGRDPPPGGPEAPPGPPIWGAREGFPGSLAGGTDRILGARKKGKNCPFSDPCDAKSRGSGGAPPTHLILLRNQRPAVPAATTPSQAPGEGGGGGSAGVERAWGLCGWGGVGPCGAPPGGKVVKKCKWPPAGCRRGGLQEKGMMLAQLGAHLRLRQELRLRREQSGLPSRPG